VRDLHENPGPVARVGFAAAGAAVVQIEEHRQGVADDFVRFPALDVDDKPHPARFMLILRVVKTLFRRQSGGRSRHIRFQTHRLILSQIIRYSLLDFAKGATPELKVFSARQKNDAQIR
jgi:hypothetical protein